jgi:hypothetical protein
MDESHQPQEFFAAEYAPMSEKELTKLSYEYDNLIEPAQAALRDELKKRGMELPKPRPQPEPIKVPAPSLYGSKSNRQLLKIALGYDALPEATQTALREEFASRGLEPPLVDDDRESDQETEPAEQGDELLNDSVSDLVTVRTYRDLPAAYVARAYLEAAGIPCVLRDENMVRTDWFLSNAIGGAKLQVPSANAVEANEKLSQPIPASFEYSTGQEFVQPVCPKCGSLDVMADDMDRKIKTGSVAVFPLATPSLTALPFVQQADWKCNACGCRWVDDGKSEPVDSVTVR